MSQPNKENENLIPFKGSYADFKAKVNEDGKSGKLIVVTFLAQWCAPCRRLSGMLPQMASENHEVWFYKIDVDENPELAEQYEITGIPNVRLFKASKDPSGDPIQVAEIQGLDNPALREAINAHSKA